MPPRPRVRRFIREQLALVNPQLRKVHAEPVERQYVFYGAAREALNSDAPELMLSGPAGTGKSVCLLFKVHTNAMRYAGSRHLICRKTRTSLSETGLVTFENHVLPPGSVMLQGPQRRNRQSYRYPNGSEIVIGGMDRATKIMSSDFDTIFVQEALELTENEWESLTTRLRHGRMPYQQIVGDTNPDAPRHWIRLRSNNGLLKLLESTHEDNPALFDREKQRWTDAGQQYIEKLDRLTGVRYQRYRLGKWVAAEGVIHDWFDRSVHLIDTFPIPKDWPRYWSIDFGFTNPFVLQCWAESPDGDLHMYREIYFTKRLVEDHAKTIMAEVARSGDPLPLDVICDHDAEDRATFESKTGLVTSAAHKAVSPGLQAVAERGRIRANGKPRLFFHRDALIERDEDLAERKKPTCTVEEIDSYVWDTTANRRRGEQPAKTDDHGMDALRYIVATLDLQGSMEIDDELHQQLFG
jgi:phage terminase large subunit